MIRDSACLDGEAADSIIAGPQVANLQGESTVFLKGVINVGSEICAVLGLTISSKLFPNRTLWRIIEAEENRK